MKAIALKVKTYTGGISIIDNNNLEHRALNSIFLCLAILGLVYVVLLGNMVFNIVERKAYDKEARAISNEVSDLELSYLKEANKIDLNLSYSMGFKETNTKYATRKSLGSIKVPQNEI